MLYNREASLYTWAANYTPLGIEARSVVQSTYQRFIKDYVIPIIPKSA